MNATTLAPPLTRPARLDQGASLFLDVDGTLAPLAPRPDDVGPTPRRTALLRRLGVWLDGRLAAVSGRDLATIDRILGGAVAAASGVHGLERRRPDGEVIAVAPHPALGQVKAQFEAFAATRSGVLVEDKRLSVGLHYRGAREYDAECLDLTRRTAEATGLTLQTGDLVAEVKTPGGDKGAAVAAFMAEPPFAAGRPVFVGDDLTDEAAFAAVAELGGFGVLVGAARQTWAHFRLDGVEDVLSWLERSMEA